MNTITKKFLIELHWLFEKYDVSDVEFNYNVDKIKIKMRSPKYIKLPNEKTALEQFVEKVVYFENYKNGVYNNIMEPPICFDVNNLDIGENEND